MSNKQKEKRKKRKRKDILEPQTIRLTILPSRSWEGNHSSVNHLDEKQYQDKFTCAIKQEG
jgi:hypothetical protein